MLVGCFFSFGWIVAIVYYFMVYKKIKRGTVAACRYGRLVGLRTAAAARAPGTPAASASGAAAGTHPRRRLRHRPRRRRLPRHEPPAPAPPRSGASRARASDRGASRAAGASGTGEQYARRPAALDAAGRSCPGAGYQRAARSSLAALQSAVRCGVSRAACRNAGMSRSSSGMRLERRDGGAGLLLELHALLLALRAVEARGDHGHADLVHHRVVDDGAEDDVRLGMRGGGHDLGRLVDLEQAEVRCRRRWTAARPARPRCCSRAAGSRWRPSPRRAHGCRRRRGRCP